MSHRSIHIREVEIHRVLGVHQGEGFKLDDVSPGINLLFGPNGSGKSTTCRVVQELLWPGGLQRPSVGGVIEDADGEWRIDIDAGHPQCHHDGRPGTLPDFGSRENRKRYLLGLSDLFIDDNADFAKKIADASQGGYDLEKASDVLGFRARPKSRKSECDELQERIGKVDGARQTQLDIEREAKRLADLHHQLEEAQEAQRELDVLREARDYHDAVLSCRELKLEIDAFPEGVARLQGDERKQLDTLAEEKKGVIERRTKEETQLRHAEKELEALNLPVDGVPDDRLGKLRALKNSLRDLEARINDQRRRRDEAVGNAEDALRRLGDHFTEEQLSVIDSIENPELGEFARRVHRLRAREEVLRERRNWLELDEPEETRALIAEELREGISTLTHWLASASTAKEGWRPSWLSGIAVLILALSGVIMIWSALVLWIAVVVASILLLAIDWLVGTRRKTSADANPREVYRRAYSKLSLPGPEAWNEDAVAKLLRRLVQLSSTKTLFSERRARLDQTKADAEGLEAARADLENERAEIQARHGVKLEIGDEWLPVLVDRIRDWQHATSHIAAAEAALAAPTAERADLEGRINDLLSPYGYEPIETSNAAEERIADLERRSNRYQSAVDARDAASERLEGSVLPELESNARKRAHIFERLELDESREAVLDGWLEKHSSYRELKEKFAKAEAIRDDRASALAERPDLVELDRSEIEQCITECEAAAGERDALNQTIGEITQQIKDAKTGHTLSNALEKRDEALQVLAEARDENARAVAGAVLTEWIRREAVEKSRPQVFERANELFVRFTRGTFRLEMDDHATTPAFVARRGTLPHQSLNELSDGERIQLMVAVRLAFLEQDETKRLPLLVDEVLGTSDDGRSGILIDTMIDIARQGRQVFYCTAQHDEVGKWKARLAAAEMPFKVHDLGEIRGGAAHRTEPLEIAVFETAQPPKPDGLSYEEYGRALAVSGLKPNAETIDGVHLWHILNDSQLLFELLCKDITTWGQLQTLIAHGGAGLVDIKNGSFERAQAAARAIRTACEAWRIGRGRSVDRAALMDSECVSDRFIDEVSELARSVDGDAAAVIRALDERAVSNWRSDNTERLREYLEEEDYLSVQSPLSRSDLRVRVLAAVAEELHSDVLEHAFVDRIVAEVYANGEAVPETV